MTTIFNDDIFNHLNNLAFEKINQREQLSISGFNLTPPEIKREHQKKICLCKF